MGDGYRSRKNNDKGLFCQIEIVLINENYIQNARITFIFLAFYFYFSVSCNFNFLLFF